MVFTSQMLFLMLYTMLLTTGDSSLSLSIQIWYPVYQQELKRHDGKTKDWQ